MLCIINQSINIDAKWRNVTTSSITGPQIISSKSQQKNTTKKKQRKWRFLRDIQHGQKMGNIHFRLTPYNYRGQQILIHNFENEVLS